jgi:hypothetical protein
MSSPFKQEIERLAKSSGLPVSQFVRELIGRCGRTVVDQIKAEKDNENA